MKRSRRANIGWGIVAWLVGIQFVDIPEFTDLGTQVSQAISSAIAGQTSVEQALTQGQQLAATVAKKYQGK